MNGHSPLAAFKYKVGHDDDDDDDVLLSALYSLNIGR